MNHRGIRAVTLAAAALAIALVSAGCITTEQPTPIIKIQTPVPTVASQAPQTTTPVATPKATPKASFTPWPTLTPSAPPTPVPTPAPTAPPSAGPTSPAASCTGTAGNQAFFLQAAAGVKFTVYCATKLGTGWGLAKSPQTGWSGSKAGGSLLIYYQYRSTASRLDVCEGSFAASNCSGSTGSIGTASFGGLSGELDSTTDGFAIRVAPGTNHAYTLVGHNVTQAALVSIGASFKVVPKP